MKTLKLHNAAGGVYPNGNATLIAGDDIELGQPLMLSGGKVVPTAAATSAAIGIALDDAEDGDTVPVALLGVFTGTVLLLSAGGIAAGAQITAAGATTSENTDVIIGRALEAATGAGELINIAHQVAQVK